MFRIPLLFNTYDIKLAALGQASLEIIITWLTFTSDAEIVNTVSRQHIEFFQKPFQLFVPNKRQNWVRMILKLVTRK